MKTWSFYSMSNGLFAGRAYSGPDDSIEANTPVGFVAIEGSFDRHAQRVDLATGQVIVDELLGAERDTQRRRDVALRTIAALELTQLRPERELRLNPANETAQRKMEEIEAAIVIERAKLSVGA